MAADTELPGHRLFISLGHLLQGLLKHSWLGPTQVPNTVSLTWGLEISISKFHGGLDVAGLGATF